MSHADAKIALLIDADNSPASKIDMILSELAKYGVVYIRRAYGNWKSLNLRPWEEILHEYAIQPIQQFDYSKGKNATDIKLVIDAMDLLYTHKLDAFGIVSSDGDFTPLIMRIHANGLKVYGFGKKKTPDPFVNACSTFTYLEVLELIKEDAGEKPEISVRTSSPSLIEPTDPGSASQKPPLKSDTKLMNLLRSAVDATAGEDGWSLMSAVGTHISNKASFDCRNYGFKKLSDIFQEVGLFELRTDQKGRHLVRRRQKNIKPKSAPPFSPPPEALSFISNKATNNELREVYAKILKDKGWESLSKFSLMNFYRAMKDISCRNKQELVAHALRIRPTAKENDARKAFDIFSKAHLFNKEATSAGEKCMRLMDYSDYLSRIDEALVSRLVRGSQEQDIEINSHVLAGWLYETDDPGLLKAMLDRLANNAEAHS